MKKWIVRMGCVVVGLGGGCLLCGCVGEGYHKITLGTPMGDYSWEYKTSEKPSDTPTKTRLSFDAEAWDVVRNWIVDPLKEAFNGVPPENQ